MNLIKRLLRLTPPSPLPGTNLRILAFADLHYWDLEELKNISGCDYDICVLLGDIPRTAIEDIIRFVGEKPILAVLGNHDTWDMFDDLPVVDLHRKTEAFNGVRFAGFGGSVWYKKGPYAMYTQEEALSLLKTLPAADILLSHDCSAGLFGKDCSHAGLKGITRYIKRNKIRLNICGHHHQSCIKEKNGCKTVCVYRCALISYPEISVQHLF